MAEAVASRFQGATWERDFDITGNREAEMGLVFLVLTDPSVADQILDRAEPLDFLYTDCKYVFTELAAMRKAGLPPGDKAALKDWFQRPEVIHHMKQAKLDWYHTETREPHILGYICAILVDGQWAAAANLEFYLTKVRKLRVQRGLLKIAYDLGLVVNDCVGEPEVPIQWLEKRVVAIRKLANTIPTPNNQGQNNAQTQEGPTEDQQETRGAQQGVESTAT